MKLFCINGCQNYKKPSKLRTIIKIFELLWKLESINQKNLVFWNLLIPSSQNKFSLIKSFYSLRVSQLNINNYNNQHNNHNWKKKLSEIIFLMSKKASNPTNQNKAFFPMQFIDMWTKDWWLLFNCNYYEQQKKKSPSISLSLFFSFGKIFLFFN